MTLDGTQRENDDFLGIGDYSSEFINKFGPNVTDRRLDKVFTAGSRLCKKRVTLGQFNTQSDQNRLITLPQDVSGRNLKATST